MKKNPFKFRWGEIIAYAFLGYILIINSSLYVGLVNIGTAYDQQVWFWPIDQQKVDYLAQNIPKNETILYNLQANPFFPLKTENKIFPIELNQAQISIVSNYLKNQTNATVKAQYDDLLATLKTKYTQPIIFDNVKPPGNTSPTYPCFTNFDEYKQIITDLTSGYQVKKTFDDGAKIYQKN